MRRKVFLDRELELNTLEKIWTTEDFSLVIIYGRRRIGKTRLITEFAKGKKSIYYVAVESQYELLTREFSDIVKKLTGFLLGGDILEIIDGVTSLINEKILIVLDEFQYIVNADPSFTSRLQRLIDTKLSNKKLMLIVCGSAVSFFEKKFLGYKSPIFGRRTSSLRINALNLINIKGFFPRYDLISLIYAYSIVGGTPGYLEKLDPEKAIEENIKTIITPGSYLFDEAPNLLKQEVREPKVYFSILAAISEGRTSFSEVASIAKIDPRSLTKYLDLLENLDIIKRVRPVGYKKPVKLYIRDNYFRFWFTYIYKLKSLLETGLIDDAYSYITNTLDKYISYSFENIVEELVPVFVKRNIIRTRPVQIGKWWHKDTEIDIIVREPAVSTTFIEVKWQEIKRKEAKHILQSLIEKSAKTGLISPVNYYLLVCKRLSDAKTPLTEGEHELVIDLNYISDIFNATEKSSYANKRGL